ncbi:3-dehydroquinate synthase [Lachnospiraceae bacterium WCA-693-APC-MOT-I]|uniref:3-dehydroquinate synthase n=1 Tax=Velocimicrobium porci TaxID=2606634 RepID=A0A6L5XZC8_9FIRM|nr:3-dehydroquinate synthase [Velocimicrobium porci]MSS63969.1 3-dehydroquinate synthase [Velocimicrobium porci]
MDIINKELIITKEDNPIYTIYIENNYNKLSSVIDKLQLEHGKALIVTDSNIGIHYAQEVKSIVNQSIPFVEILTLEPGEANKNIETIQKIYHTLISYQFDRKDILIALGGGVVGDMTGFAAATYLRGIRFIQLPTSLLAMVDSSIGGKTGVDYLSYKNMVGAFHQPSAVYINLQVLNTLPEREYYSGFGEIIKHGLIKDKSYYRWLKSNSSSILSRENESLTEMIYRSCSIKKQVVESDPHENGERALLNFGHTVGHSIEKQLNFSYLHGECVSLGIVAAAQLSYEHGNLSIDELEDIKETLKQFKLPVCLSNVSFSSKIIAQTTRNDKKMEAGQIKFILLHSIGAAYIDKTITEQEIESAVQLILI